MRFKIQMHPEHRTSNLKTVTVVVSVLILNLFIFLIEG